MELRELYNSISEYLIKLIGVRTIKSMIFGLFAQSILLGLIAH